VDHRGPPCRLLFEVATLERRRFVAREASDGFSVEWQLEVVDESPET
jgi:hypothetical protein